MSIRPIRSGSVAKDAKADLATHVVECLAKRSSVREALPGGGRIHIDRPLPFLCVCETDDPEETAAHEIATANASYLTAPDLSVVAPLVEAVSAAMTARFGTFLVVEVSELAEDVLLTDDSPYTPPFEIIVTATPDAGTQRAADCLIEALEAVDARYRAPQVDRRAGEGEPPRLSVAFAPIYRRPGGDGIYPGLRHRVVENIFDAILRGVAGFANRTGVMEVTTHRAMGRQMYVDTVRKLDDRIDAIARSFDFLMAVTPINADAAWAEFEDSSFTAEPRLLYRPLPIETDDMKRELFSIPFENLEDPLLADLYREKQAELELQLTLLDLRGTPKFREAGRVLYGPVEPGLLAAAEGILAVPERAGEVGGGGREGFVDCYELRDAACGMIAQYRAEWDEFDPEVEIRDDLPPGMMVSGPKLMISRSTRMARSRVEALLSHEVGVHLLTYFNGDAQGLHLFRSGLAGYEAVQEGLAVLGEYLVGGLTRARMRLLAARVVGCAPMLEGATFAETYRLLHREHGFSPSGAFNVTLRLHRSGGFAKDAIYLRGLFEVLKHIAAGNSLSTFWLGKFAGTQVALIDELAARGLLRPAAVEPLFLEHEGAAQRLATLRDGASPSDLIS